MKKLLFLTLFIAGAVFKSNAQSEAATINLGEINEIQGNYGGIVFSNNEFIISSSIGRNKIFLEKYDVDLKIIAKGSLEELIKFENGEAKFSYCKSIGGKLFAFYDFKYKNDNRYRLIVYAIDLDNLVLDLNYIVLDETIYQAEKLPLKLATALGLVQAKYRFLYNQDSSQIILITGIKGDTENLKFRLNVFDNQLKKKWNRDIELTSSAESYGLLNVVIDDKNNIYLIGKVKESAEEAEKTSYSYVINRINEKKENDKELSVSGELDGYEIKEFRFLMSGKLKDAFIIGLYASPDKEDKENGTFLMKVEKESLSLISTKLFKSKEIMPTSTTEDDNNKSSNREAKINGRIEDYFDVFFQLRKIIPNENGGMMLIFEEYYNYDTKFTSNTGFTTIVSNYEYNDLIVVSINDKEEILWSKKVPKYQFTNNYSQRDLGAMVNSWGRTSSFAYMKQGNKTYLFFNDNIKNTLPENNGKRHSTFGLAKNQTFTILTIDENGNIKRESLLTLNESKMTLLPKEAIAINEKKMIVYGDYNGKQRLFSVYLK